MEHETNVILGSTGFIGKHLMEKIPNSRGISVRNENWEIELKSLKIDSIINLVGKAHDHSKLATEQDYYYANFDLTKKIFLVFLNSSAKLFVHISSLAAVEEFESSQPLKEDDICRPISWYGKSKREAEKWLIEHQLPIGKQLVIIRPPMIHGVGDKGNLRLLYKVVSKGIPYPLSAFNNSRSFISIDNFIFFIQQIIEKKENLGSGIFNVADDEVAATKEIVNIIRHLTKSNMPNISLPQFVIKCIARIGDLLPIPLNSNRLKKMTSDLLVSNERIKKLLNIKELPLTAHEGIEKTIRSFQENSI